MNNINNDKKIINFLESINEKYSIGKFEGCYLNNKGELKMYFDINSFIFTLVMIKKEYKELYEYIENGKEELAHDKMVDFIIRCFDDIDMKHIFNGYYEPENETHNPFELVDYLRVLQHYINDLLKDLKSDKN